MPNMSKMLSGEGVARAIMLQGTGSDVGKTILAAGLCRLARHRGLRVMPFKPQNMSNNAAVAQEGGEIGRGQWLQAVAAGQAPSVHMNPVLLKPQSDTGAQVIVQGKLWATAHARDYQRLKRDLLGCVQHSFQQLKREADLIVVEGAGAAAEVNLRDHDIANMGFASVAQVPVVLVGDIDRGGVIASLVGSHTILPPADRALIGGFLINKFRGDVRLFEQGIKTITRHTGWSCFGIVPWLDVVAHLPAEDSWGLAQRQSSEKSEMRKVMKIVVPITSTIANLDDLDPLAAEDEVDLLLLRPGEVWPQNVDLVLLPGAKSTMAGMAELQNYGWAEAICRFARAGGEVVGLCGGLQMLGRRIIDREGIEGKKGEMPGLGLLAMETVMGQQKILRNVRAVDTRFGENVTGYEIHSGISHGEDCARPSLLIEGRADGATDKSGKIWGTYLHGLFANGVFRAKYLATFGVRSNAQDQYAVIDHALDDIATALEASLDCDSLFAMAR